MIFLCNPKKKVSQYPPPLTNICLHFEKRVMLPPLTHSSEGQTLPLLMTKVLKHHIEKRDVSHKKTYY